MPLLDAADVAKLEDVLDLDAAPCDPARPVVCVAEHPSACTAPTRDPLPAKPGRVATEDDAYARCGSGTVFLAFQPWAGWRTGWVPARRTRAEFATFLTLLVEEHCPAATTIRLVGANRNTHAAAAVSVACPAAEARRIARKLAWHYTPPHGSWLNLAAIELSVLARQCRKRRRQDRALVERDVAAWAARRTAAGATVHWHFTVTAARDRFRRLHPEPACHPATDARPRLTSDGNPMTQLTHAA